MSENISAPIHTFVQARMPHPIADTEDIFATGAVNSLFAMELVLHVEDTFGIQVPDNELDLANFSTIAAITALVERLPRATKDAVTA